MHLQDAATFRYQYGMTIRTSPVYPDPKHLNGHRWVLLTDWNRFT